MLLWSKSIASEHYDMIKKNSIDLNQVKLLGALRSAKLKVFTCLRSKNGVSPITSKKNKINKSL